MNINLLFAMENIYESSKLSYGGIMVFIGMATVFSVLVLIMLSLYGFKFFFHDLPNKRAAEVKQAPAPVEQVVEAPSSNDEEIVAAIAAAIAMAESESANGTKFRVVSFIRK